MHYAGPFARSAFPAAQWLSNYGWDDAKCRNGCEGELAQRKLRDDEDPEFETIVLKWRVRDAFGFVTWEKYPEDVRAAFEAMMLAREVLSAYRYARNRSLLRY
jgi:hypothetical protein